MADILRLSENVKGAYNFYCRHFLRPIISDKTWKSKNYVLPLSDTTFVTATDESLGLLILENNWDFWIALAKASPQDERVDWANYPPKYTAEARKAGKGKGWNDAGRDRFIGLTTLIRVDRARAVRKAFEETFLEDMKEAGRVKKRTPPPPVPTVTPRKELPNDLPPQSDSSDDEGYDIQQDSATATGSHFVEEV